MPERYRPSNMTRALGLGAVDFGGGGDGDGSDGGDGGSDSDGSGGPAGPMPMLKRGTDANGGANGGANGNGGGLDGSGRGPRAAEAAVALAALHRLVDGAAGDSDSDDDDGTRFDSDDDDDRGGDGGDGARGGGDGHGTKLSESQGAYSKLSESQGSSSGHRSFGASMDGMSVADTVMTGDHVSALLREYQKPDRPPRWAGEPLKRLGESEEGGDGEGTGGGGSADAYARILMGEMYTTRTGGSSGDARGGDAMDRSGHSRGSVPSDDGSAAPRFSIRARHSRSRSRDRSVGTTSEDGSSMKTEGLVKDLEEYDDEEKSVDDILMKVIDGPGLKDKDDDDDCDATYKSRKSDDGVVETGPPPAAKSDADGKSSASGSTEAIDNRTIAKLLFMADENDDSGDEGSPKRYRKLRGGLSSLKDKLGESSSNLKESLQDLREGLAAGGKDLRGSFTGKEGGLMDLKDNLAGKISTLSEAAAAAVAAGDNLETSPVRAPPEGPSLHEGQAYVLEEVPTQFREREGGRSRRNRRGTVESSGGAWNRRGTVESDMWTAAPGMGHSLRRGSNESSLSGLLYGAVNRRGSNESSTVDTGQSSWERRPTADGSAVPADEEEGEGGCKRRGSTDARTRRGSTSSAYSWIGLENVQDEVERMRNGDDDDDGPEKGGARGGGKVKPNRRASVTPFVDDMGNFHGYGSDPGDDDGRSYDWWHAGSRWRYRPGQKTVKRCIGVLFAIAVTIASSALIGLAIPRSSGVHEVYVPIPPKNKTNVTLGLADGGNYTPEDLFVIARSVDEHCRAELLTSAAGRWGCTQICHDHFCCFDPDEGRDCRGDERKLCATFAGCEALVLEDVGGAGDAGGGAEGSEAGYRDGEEEDIILGTTGEEEMGWHEIRRKYVDAYCAPSNVETKEGRKQCGKVCERHFCCFDSGVGSDNCRDDPSMTCGAYAGCQSLLGGLVMDDDWTEPAEGAGGTGTGSGTGEVLAIPPGMLGGSSSLRPPPPRLPSSLGEDPGGVGPFPPKDAIYIPPEKTPGVGPFPPKDAIYIPPEKSEGDGAVPEKGAAMQYTTEELIQMKSDVDQRCSRNHDPTGRLHCERACASRRCCFSDEGPPGCGDDVQGTCDAYGRCKVLLKAGWEWFQEAKDEEGPAKVVLISNEAELEILGPVASEEVGDGGETAPPKDAAIPPKDATSSSGGAAVAAATSYTQEEVQEMKADMTQRCSQIDDPNGLRFCQQTCRYRLCCFAHGAHTCRTDPTKYCEVYESCQVLLGTVHGGDEGPTSSAAVASQEKGQDVAGETSRPTGEATPKPALKPLPRPPPLESAQSAAEKPPPPPPIRCIPEGDDIVNVEVYQDDWNDDRYNRCRRWEVKHGMTVAEYWDLHGIDTKLEKDVLESMLIVDHGEVKAGGEDWSNAERLPALPAPQPVPQPVPQPAPQSEPQPVLLTDDAIAGDLDDAIMDDAYKLDDDMFLIDDMADDDQFLVDDLLNRFRRLLWR